MNVLFEKVKLANAIGQLIQRAGTAQALEIVEASLATALTRADHESKKQNEHTRLRKKA
jgi:hypothetical protein